MKVLSVRSRPVESNLYRLSATASAEGIARPTYSAVTRCLGRVKPLADLGVRSVEFSRVASDPIGGIECAPLRRPEGMTRKVFAVESADRRDKNEHERVRDTEGRGRSHPERVRGWCK